MLFGIALVLWVALDVLVAALLQQDAGGASLGLEAVLMFGFSAMLLGLARHQGQGAALRIGGRPESGWGWPVALVLLGFLPLILLTVALSLIGHDRPAIGQIGVALLFGAGVAVVKGLVFWAALRRAMVVRFGVIGGVIATAGVYGAFHLLSLLNGWPPGLVLAQAAYAALAGLLYAAMAQRVGVLWPVMLVQAIWEALIALWLLDAGPASMAGAAILMTGAAHMTAELLSLRDLALAFWVPEPALGLLMLMALILRQRRSAAQGQAGP